METREYRKAYRRACAFCETPYETWNKASRYCSERCRTDAATARRLRGEGGEWLRKPVSCGVCGAAFFRTLKTGPNKKYCSRECSRKARRRDHRAFRERNPLAMTTYNRTRATRHGHDTLMNRLRRKHPDLPRACEVPGCGEGRVLDLAHVPEHRRDGAPRTLSRYERHMFWVLCPTHHRILDDEVETPEEMGLR